MNSDLSLFEQSLFLIVWTLFIYIGGAVTSRFVARLLDTVWRRWRQVIRTFVRVLGIETRAARSAAATAKSRGLGYLTDLDAALRVIDASPDDSVSTDELPSYDFKLEEKLLKREQGYFRCIRIPPESGYIPDSLTKKMTEDVKGEYIHDANNFFNNYVQLHANEKSLYDDAEGAVTVSLFRNSDRRCFYVLNEMRKTINGNIWRMVCLFSAIWIAAAIALVWAFSGESWEVVSTTVKVWADSEQSIGTKASSTLAYLGKPLSGVFSVLIAAGLIAIFQASGYQKQQEHSARELNWFLSRWLDRVSDRYRDAVAEAKGVTVGEEKDTKKVSDSAKTWHKIMMWMAFRSFFIESFYRNIRFQIDRNRTYYDMGPAIVLFVAAIILSIVYSNFAELRPSDVAMASVLGLLFAAVTFVYWRWYHRKVVPVELDENWLGFGNLELGQVMDEVVGKYGEEVGYWKNRTGRID